MLTHEKKVVDLFPHAQFLKQKAIGLVCPKTHRQWLFLF
ncbi:hypothetical protein FTV88_0660 [Heliorestis convoluta]|uniref:Uncharacterized protein n=1 Tax=Heliorestis convoluta TaxID=356322 RepID=A0A5Q2MWM3_9FIRM|nr:hypothetical protein FTV88_0660 [Heliorestis convoluta]